MTPSEQPAQPPDVTDAFLAAMSTGTSTTARGNCSDAAPGDGLVECMEPVGATFDWMAYRWPSGATTNRSAGPRERIDG